MEEKIRKGIKYQLDERELTAKVIRKRGYSGDIVIPETVVSKKVSYKVTTIGYAAFENCESLTSIIIPKSVRIIEGFAFKGCKYLTSINIPYGRVFGHCSMNLGGIYDPLIYSDTVKVIKSSAFEDCESLTSINIIGVYDIGRSAFKNCKSLTSISIPYWVKSLDESTFEGCESLKSITIRGTINIDDLRSKTVNLSLFSMTSLVS